MAAASVKAEPNSAAKVVVRPASEIDAKVGENFRRLACSAGWSQTKTAEALELNSDVLSAIETGELRAGGELVVRAARLFGVSPSIFFDLDSSEKGH